MLGNFLKICSTILQTDFPSFLSLFSPLSLEKLEIILSPDMWPDHYRKWPNFLCVHAISLVCAASWKKKIIWETTAISGDRYVNIVVLRHAKVWIWYSKENNKLDENWNRSFFPFFFLFSSQVNRFLEDLIIMQIKWRSAMEQKSIETILYGDYIRKFQSGSRILLVRVFFSVRTNSSFGHVIRSFLFQLISTLIYNNYLSL